MSLAKGQRFGPYEIEGIAGAGGMGEVYKARDTRLDRTVAIKVLPSHAALSTEARSRFEREAKIISSLNHPSICVLHDVGYEGGINYIVMEFLEGETLQERLKKGKIETSESLRIGAQIAAALDAAHRKGLVHRDLKPGNIVLTKEGAKLLDFGLAKVHAEAVTGMTEESHTTPVTGAGAIVGTLQYMSPEQLEGNEADARSDIFAFGATMYEMVTGERAFAGESRASIIGSIMKEEPRAISELQPTSPPALDRLIKKCLKKNPDDRWQSAKDLKDELEWIASAGSQAGIPRPVASRRRIQLRISWIMAAAFAVIAMVFASSYFFREKKEDYPVRFTLDAPENVDRIDWPLISPDGRLLAFLSFDSLGNSQIWIRPLNGLKAYPLSGTENAYRPFWSPDSKYLAYFDRRSEVRVLKKIPAAGGQPQVICKSEGADGCWGKKDIILFDDFGNDGQLIGRVSASGGESKAATVLDTANGESNHGWPCFLPDGEHFVFTSWNDSPESNFLLKVGNINDKASRVIGETESRAVYCDPGYIIYMKSGFLVAQPFNKGSLELEGEPIPISDSISFARNSDHGINASASSNGVMAMQTGTRGDNIRHLVWVDRAGTVLDTVGEPAEYCDIQLSPDNAYIASTILELPDAHLKIWIDDLRQDKTWKLTYGDGDFYFPTWSSDNRVITYANFDFSNPRSQGGILTQSDVKSGWVVQLHSSDTGVAAFPYWRKEAGELLFFDCPWAQNRENALMSIDIDDTSRVQRLLSDEGAVYTFSPDGRYFVTAVDSDTDHGLYIRDVEYPNRKYRIPVYGAAVRWSPLGDEIFFCKGYDFMTVQVNTVNGLILGSPKKLFTRRRLYNSLDPLSAWGYDVSNDARKFLFVTPGNQTGTRKNEIEVTLNWYKELKNK
ncbi:MAG TPA: serine/threonine-protein kinase [candidate division Zixibacteria bacterium]|nr:serine/threonine-protein kinase [candidate division Zixibacteria bacterium]